MQDSVWSEEKAYSSRTEEWGTPQDLFDKIGVHKGFVYEIIKSVRQKVNAK